jgi:hypothetical protein
MIKSLIRTAPAFLALLTIGTTFVAARSSWGTDAGLVASVSEDEGAAIQGGTATCPRYYSTTTGCGFATTTQKCQDVSFYTTNPSGAYGTVSLNSVTCTATGGAYCGSIQLPNSLTAGCSGS